jgi:rRNA maturation protein Nop10
MKFLCRNCKAKYQIADEKVAGRTLRMTCQQCGEPIVVRGPARTSSTANRSLAPAPMSVATQASALGADLVHQMAVPAREPAGAIHEEWHVAIHDTPVGPMRRDEVARKIAAGAIERESLAWREGMDDWLPIKHIAELAVLFGPAMGAVPLQPPAAMNTLQQAPSARGDMAPIGGRQVVAVEDYVRPVTGPVPVPIEDVPAVAVATVAPINTEPQTGARQPGWAQMFALVSGGALILALGALLGVRLIAPGNPPPPAAAPAPAPAPAPAAQPQPEAKNDTQGGNVIELDVQAIDGASNAARKSGNTAAAPATQATGTDKKKPLTAEQKELLERMGGGLNQGPSNLRAPTETAHASNVQGGGQLTSEQLSAVVLGGRKNLQRCYETALRGTNSNDTVRLDVDIEVSPSGNVTSVHTTGKGLTGMDECIVRTVRMWRFPLSGEATKTHFPVVFQPGT